MTGHFPSQDDLESQRLSREADATRRAVAAAEGKRTAGLREVAAAAVAAESLVSVLAEFASKALSGIDGALWTVPPPELQYCTGGAGPGSAWWANSHASWFVQAVCDAQGVQYRPPPAIPDRQQFYRKRLLGPSYAQLDENAYADALSAYGKYRDEWVATYATVVKASPSIVLFKTKTGTMPEGGLFSWVLLARAGFFWAADDLYVSGDWDQRARIDTRDKFIGVYQPPEDLPLLAEALVAAHLSWARDEPMSAGGVLAQRLSVVAQWGA